MRILILIALCLGCGNPDNVFLNANLDENETAWAQETMTSLCQESMGYCCASIDNNGDNTLVIVTYLPNNYSALTEYDELDIGGYSPSITSILDLSGNEESYYKYAFQCLLKHELCHHCIHNKNHIANGNMMSSNALYFPQDCKLTLEDLKYIKG
jgi:hypothetical protein